MTDTDIKLPPGDVAPNHRLDLQFALDVLTRVYAMDLPSESAHGDIGAAMQGLRYVISRIATIPADRAEREPAVPPGYALVPIEPTEEMFIEGMEADCLGMPSIDDDSHVRNIWKAMLASTPAAAAPSSAMEPMDDFRKGARAMFDELLSRAANNWHATPAMNAECKRENAIVESWAKDALEDVAPEDHQEWKSIGEAYREGLERGRKESASQPAPSAPPQGEAAHAGTLRQALERMDSARRILTDGNPRPECNWGVLDTSDLRAALASPPSTGGAA